MREEIKDNTVYNLSTIEDFYELEKSKFSRGYSNSTMIFLYNTFKSNTYFYFYEDDLNKYYLTDNTASDKLKYHKKSFKYFKEINKM